MQLQRVLSDTVEAVGYDVGTSEVHVLFKDQTYYKYANVPAAVYEGLMKSLSKGSYIHKMSKIYKGVKQ